MHCNMHTPHFFAVVHVWQLTSFIDGHIILGAYQTICNNRQSRAFYKLSFWQIGFNIRCFLTKTKVEFWNVQDVFIVQSLLYQKIKGVLISQFMTPFEQRFHNTRQITPNQNILFFGLNVVTLYNQHDMSKTQTKHPSKCIDTEQCRQSGLVRTNNHITMEETWFIAWHFITPRSIKMV